MAPSASPQVLAERAERRRALVPPITYPAGLPITERRDDLLAAIAAHQVVIVAGETGSGKSTQLPKLCLELGRGVHGMIGHTQPRRVAARAVAERVAEELGTELGGVVGYSVRFTDRVGEDTLVKVMTDGILLAEIQRDRLLRRYDTLIIDEAHERSLNIDFLLGYVTRLLPRRPDLKVIITSATIDTARFSQHFGGAPVVEVAGRTFPVEVRYRPVGEHPDDDRDQVAAICDAVEELRAEGPGDILVFLSGEREIHDAADALRRLDLPGTEILPLYARLSAAEQHRVFQPHPGRRIVLATNVAETSITVPGVRFVIDTGTARVSRYSRRRKVQRLPIEPVSRASADQRAGRCGRLGPGICIRLYAEQDYAARPAFTEPEILRTNLASVVLQMAALGLGEVAAFPFIDPPDPRSIDDAVAVLEELGAFDPAAGDPRRRLTPLGRRLAQLPIDPRLGRMILEADRLGCVREVMVIAAALSIQDPRERPADQAQAAAEAHRRFAVEGSDFLAYLGLWDHLRERQRTMSSNQFRKLCRAEYLNAQRVREWQDLFSQLRQVAGGLGIRVGGSSGHPDHIHQALLSGLLSQIGMRDGERREYRGTRGARFALAPGSVLAAAPPRWVMVAELVETTRLWGRVAARIQPEWAERLGAHLVKRSYGEPRWDARRGAVVAPETVTLFGLPVVSGRVVGYGRIDPALARTLFIRHALVDGDWHTTHPFVARNRALLDELVAVEDRVRRRGSVVDDDALERFYDERIGEQVTSGRDFDRWWARTRHRQPDLLDATPEALARAGGGDLDLDAFPGEWHHGDLVLPVTYTFDPGSPVDGVTVHVPLAVLNQVTGEGFDWQVPGYREELAVALVRTLPKRVRRHLVPLAEHARAALARAVPGQGSFTTALAEALGAVTGVRVDPADFRPEEVPDHLRITFAVEDAGGAVVAAGKDLAALRDHLRADTRRVVAGAAATIERSGLTAWELGTLPRVVEGTAAGHVVRGYPALVDEGDTVGVRVLTTPEAQAVAMAAGTRRLLARTVSAPRKAMERAVGAAATLALARTGVGTVADLVDDVIAAVIDATVDRQGGPAWDAEGFAALQDAVRAELQARGPAAVAAAAGVVVAAAAVGAQLDRLRAPKLAASVADARAQLAWLVRPWFVTAAGVDRLADLERYVRAIGRRLDRLPEDPERDQQRMAVVHRLERELDRVAAGATGARAIAVVEILWLLEELRVSLFAQTLGTRVPVSEARVRRAIERLAHDR